MFVVIVPFARQPLTPVWAFIPIYEAALAINDLITAVLLLAQFLILRTRRLLLLGCGYLFTAAMVVAHEISVRRMRWPRVNGGRPVSGSSSTSTVVTVSGTWIL